MIKNFSLLGFRMPGEWEKQDSIWITWPYNKKDWPGLFENIPFTVSKIVAAISKNQVVNLIIKPNEDKDKIKKILLGQKAKLKLVRFHKIPSNRVWIRDFGPIYLINKKIKKKVFINFQFNGWSKYNDFKLDNKINHWDKVLICGKHTSDAYGGDSSKWSSYAKLDVIVIPKEIHKNWNDMEVWKIANGDNEKNNSIEPTTKDDIVREYQVMVDNNLDWETDDEHNRVKKLLRSKGAWNYIKTRMEDYAMDKQRLSQGLGPRISWSTKSNSHRTQLEAKCVTNHGRSDE